MDLTELTPDVFACLQPDLGLGCSNSGFVRAGGGAVIDTFWDLAHTRRMQELYAGVARGPVQRVVNTHRNGDHCWGNQLFPGAEIIAHRTCAELFGLERPEAMQMLCEAGDSPDPTAREMSRRLARFDFRGIVPLPPTRLVEDRLELDLDGLAVHLIHVGPAHTAGDLLVHLPAQRIVFAGDVLFRLCTPIGWEGTTAAWLAALDTLVALDPQVIVPGHGPLCGLEGPRELRAYLEYVEREARSFFAQGVDETTAARRIDPGPYAGWTEPERIVFNVARVYRELRGEPFDAPIAIGPLFAAMVELGRRRTAHPGHA